LSKPFTLYSLRKRILAIILLVSFLFCALVVRLFVIQIINNSSLQSKAVNQWTRSISIVAPRGKIYDSTGSTLAVSYTSYNIYARGREVTNPTEVAEYLSKKLNTDFVSIYQKVTRKNISEVLIKLQVDGDIAEEIYKQNFSGIYLTENSSRYYPYGDLLTQILGFTSNDNIGQSGIEAYFNNYLAGKDGYSFTESDLQGKEIGGSLRQYVNATSGKDITLTIDSKIQLILEQTLNQIMVEQQAKNVTGIIINPKTGEILAISNKPSFDLNNIPRNDIEGLFNYSKIKAITDVYEPGSTFKILTIAAALEEELTSLDEHFYCPGAMVVDGVKIKCWKTTGHGSQTLQEGFANSCNCVFMNLALRLGVEKFYQYAKLFGLGNKTGISLAGEANGILMSQSLVKNVDLARMGFGHAIAVTPIQLLTAISSVINGGTLNTPKIISSIEEENLSNIITTSLTKTISQHTSDLVNYLLEKAENKASDCSFVEGYNVGGKTGTAQKYDNNGKIAQGKYISSFVGTYPANNPQYALIITVNEPSAGAYYGSIVAAPYGKILFTKLFKYLNLPKDNDKIKIEYIEMPDVTNLPLSQAVEVLTKLGINYEIDGEGGRVIKQLPPIGTTLAVGDTIVLITNQ